MSCHIAAPKQGSISMLLTALTFISILSLVSTSLTGRPVRYGSVIILRHQPTITVVLPSTMRYGRGGMFAVTAVPQAHVPAQSTMWQLLNQYQRPVYSIRDQIKCGDIITVQAVESGNQLHMDEVTFGITYQMEPMVHMVAPETLDADVNWELVCATKQPGEGVLFDDSVSLRHENTARFVAVDPSYVYNQNNCGGCHIIGQVEVLGDDQMSSKSIFKLEGVIGF